MRGFAVLLGCTYAISTVTAWLSVWRGGRFARPINDRRTRWLLLAVTTMLLTFSAMPGCWRKRARGGEAVITITGQSYRWIKGGLANGQTTYSDRPYVFQNVPPALKDAAYLQSADDDRESGDSKYLSFAMPDAGLVVVGRDARACTPPWLGSFLGTDLSWKSSEITFQGFVLDVTANQPVVLGGNADPSCGDNLGMYVVAFLRNQSSRALSSTPYHPVASNGCGQVQSRLGTPGPNVTHALEQHALYLANSEKGKRLDLSDRSDLLKGVNLLAADLRNSELGSANINGAHIVASNLTESQLGKASLRGAVLIQTSFKHASLAKSDLRAANLTGADLSEADLRDARLGGAALSGADLAWTIWEPEEPPAAKDVARAQNLDLLQYVQFPDQLIALKKEFADKGFSREAQEVAAAIERGRTRDADRVERVLRIAILDWTTNYGLNWKRPFLLILFNIAFFTAVYLVLLACFGSSKLVDAKENEVREISLGRCLQFSLRAALTGDSKLDLSAWLSRFLPEDSVVRPEGAIRVVSGIQAVLSVVLLTVGILCYFQKLFD
jgi:uncharacterized protein YjbI with pentapeptide repeats